MSKWLLRRASGSRAKYNYGGDYKWDRHRKSKYGDDLPAFEPMKEKRGRRYRLDTTLIKRWLHSQVGKDFDDIYSEYLSRLQPKYRHDYRESIYWYIKRPEEIGNYYSQRFFYLDKDNILRKRSLAKEKETKEEEIIKELKEKFWKDGVEETDSIWRYHKPTNTGWDLINSKYYYYTEIDPVLTCSKKEFIKKLKGREWKPSYLEELEEKRGKIKLY